MALEHQLRMASVGIPELDASVLGTAKHPLSIRREGDAKNEVLRHYVRELSISCKIWCTYLVAVEGHDAFATAGSLARDHASRRCV